MKSNYKALGKYIQTVDERNTSLEDLPLMGLSVSKQFFPTIYFAQAIQYVGSVGRESGV